MNKSNLANKVKNTLREDKPAGVKRLGDAKKNSSVKKIDANDRKESGSKD